MEEEADVLPALLLRGPQAMIAMNRQEHKNRRMRAFDEVSYFP